MDRIKLDMYPLTPKASSEEDAQNARAIRADAPQDVDIKQIRQKLEAAQGETFWQSLDELANTAAFQAFIEEEFPRQAGPLEGSVDRRDFMKLLGGSLALAGLSACARPPMPPEKIVPYVKAPEEIIPGLPLFYSSTFTLDGYGYGMLVESHQGRPTKIEGNPEHPASLGSSDSFMQATVLELYDPDRSQTVTRKGATSSLEDFKAALGNQLKNTNGQDLHILTGPVTSPTFAHLMERIQTTYPNTTWHQYSVSNSDAIHAGAEQAFGRKVEPRYSFDKADIVVSLASDFLHEGADKLVNNRQFMSRRKVHHADEAMNRNRTYVFEPTPTPTGGIADHRAPVKAADIELVARAIAQRIGLNVGNVMLPEGFDTKLIDALVEDLQAHQGSSLVVAGATQPASVHMLVYAINHALGNVGNTINFYAPVTAQADKVQSLQALVEAINSGTVGTLLIFNDNPVYTAPIDFKFADALAKVPFSVHLGLHHNETSAKVTWCVPQTHGLETWSDAKAFDGTVSISQPLIAPLYNTQSAEEVLAVVLGEDTSSGDLVKDYWKQRVDGDFDAFWREALYRGVVAGTATQPENVSLNTSALSLPPVVSERGLELVFKTDPTIYDGRYNNNSWLQEAPKPLTKLVWDNAALISPKLAEHFSLKNEDVIVLKINGENLKIPVWIMPGQATESITVYLGYGREVVGHVGEGTGFNAYKLRTSTAPWFQGGLEVAKTRQKHVLVSTQSHQMMEHDRHIIRHGTLAEFEAQPEHPHFVHPVQHHDRDLYPNYKYEGYAWGMAIDMNVCTGCNACVVACQAENNIPVVGKTQVGKAREMHWLRIDHFFSGDLDNPDIYSMPVTCMHCEKATCEPVCPFGATVHDHEGLNVMVYNRCGGTRYCSNACPYKVRRFNWLQYAELPSTETSLSLQKNPNVTVRSRGVMEKCTYCTQRIASARIQANNENRRIADGEVVTACQAACASGAISFGDLSDVESEVVKVKASPLNYGLLTELNTYPRTTYLARVNNPHPSLAPAVSVHDLHGESAAGEHSEPVNSAVHSTEGGH